MDKRVLVLLLVAMLGVTACAGAAAPAVEKKQVGVLVPPEGDKDKGFSEYTIKGAREAAASAGLDFAYVVAEENQNFEKHLEKMVADGTDLIITVGFQMAQDTAAVAKKHADVKFAIVDADFSPGFGCAETAKDCYSEEGGLGNVTSLMFAGDEIGYLAGVLAACVSKSGTVASVAGVELPPVVRFVKGYQSGAKWAKPNVVTLNQYIPDFWDPETGQAVGQDFIGQGADVIFGVGGMTGNGGLLAAKEAGLMAIGVDSDQYLTYPEAKEVLLTSAVKNVDVAANGAVKDFAAGTLKGGIRLGSVASGGVGLASYHDWDSKISAECKAKVEEAKKALAADPTITGAK